MKLHYFLKFTVLSVTVVTALPTVPKTDPTLPDPYLYTKEKRDVDTVPYLYTKRDEDTEPYLYTKRDEDTEPYLYTKRDTAVAESTTPEPYLYTKRVAVTEE